MYACAPKNTHSIANKIEIEICKAQEQLLREQRQTVLEEEKLIKIQHENEIKLFHEKQKLEAIQKGINTDDVCMICYDGKREYLLDPCGHVFCGKCVKLIGSECAMCRTKFAKKIKIYF